MMTLALSVRLKRAILAFIATLVVESRSINVQILAPLERASKPMLPVPAKQSTTVALEMVGASQLKSVSRTRSGVGLKPSRSSTSSFERLRFPPMMRTPLGCFRLCISFLIFRWYHST